MRRLLRRYTLLAILVVLALLWVVLLSIPFERSGGARAADGASGRFTMVDEAAFPTISAYALLQDDAGKVLEGIPQNSFTLTEDGIPVPFTFTAAGEQPLSVMLVLDRSGSMEDERKMAGAITAAQTFIDLLRPGHDSLGMTLFSDDIEALLPLDKLGSDADKQAARSLVGGISPDGATRLNDAIIEAVDGMQGTTGRRVIVALTDGMSDGDTSSAEQSTAYATDAGVPVFTIGLGSDVDGDQLRRIAQETGGAYYFAPGAAELARLYSELARALQNEYSFTYASPVPRLDGTRRVLKLQVDRAAGQFSVSDDYAVGGVLVLERSPLLLASLAGTLVLLAVVPSIVGRRRRVRSPVPAGLPAQSGMRNTTLEAEGAIARHPYRKPLVMPDEAAAIPTPQRRFTVMLRNERTTIGSEPNNDVVLPGLAPHHAAITRQDGRWVVAPAGGEIMVAYNGEANAERRIIGTNALKHGSVIRLETVRAIFQAKDQPELLIVCSEEYG